MFRFSGINDSESENDVCVFLSVSEREVVSVHGVYDASASFWLVQICILIELHKTTDGITLD